MVVDLGLGAGVGVVEVWAKDGMIEKRRRVEIGATSLIMRIVMIASVTVIGGCDK